MPNVSTDLLQVRHVTRYRYKSPVRFGDHTAMFRPHEANDLRLTAFDIQTTPAAAQRWVHDVFSNTKTILDFSAAEPSDELTISCVFNVVRSTVHEPSFPIADFARAYPFDYPAEQKPDVAALVKPEYDHPGKEIRQWALRFVEAAGGDTWTVLKSINSAIHEDFEYVRREEPGIQAPRESFNLGRGSCRDFAVLMMEAVRELGFAARFVTGYLYDPLVDDNGGAKNDVGAPLVGAGATHAWVQVLLPGAGWIEFDPTNGLIASGNLIRTGVARTPSQAVPLEGSFHGPRDAFIDMDVDVKVISLAPTLRG
ncbi:MAG: transglutaminase family protein [Parvularculaceae bacterium]